MGEPTLNGAEKDDKAWEKIGDLMELQEFEEAKATFMTRCAESAQEALAEGAELREALEGCYQTTKEWVEDLKAQYEGEGTAKTGQNITIELRPLREAVEIVDALAPATQANKEESNE